MPSGTASRPTTSGASPILTPALADHPALELADALGDQLRRRDLPAAKLGIPVRELIRARLQAAPFDGYLWQTLLDGCPAAEIGGLVTLAQDLLPLADLATGPARSRGLGPVHTPDRALSTIVSHLGAHPGHGWILINTALRSPVIRDALRAEPEPKTRESMEQLLSAWHTGMMS